MAITGWANLKTLSINGLDAGLVNGHICIEREGPRRSWSIEADVKGDNEPITEQVRVSAETKSGETITGMAYMTGCGPNITLVGVGKPEVLN